MCADVSHRWKIAIEVLRRCERVGGPKREEKRGSFSRDWHEHAIDGLLWSGKKDERERPLKGVHRGLRSGRPHGVVWSAKKKRRKERPFHVTGRSTQLTVFCRAPKKTRGRGLVRKSASLDRKCASVFCLDGTHVCLDGES